MLRLFILFLFFPVLSIAQNYETIRSGSSAAYLYKSGNDSVYTYYIPELDSQYLNFTVYKNYFSADDDIPTYLDSSQAWIITDTAWIGHRMIKMNNGDEIYINNQGDSIFFPLNIVLNDTWILYSYSNGNYIQATYSALLPKLIFGQTDSIRIISLQVYNNLHQQISHPINAFSFEISKLHGFYKLLNLRHFPTKHNPYVLESEDGTNQPLYNLTAATIFKYDVGDLFQYIKRESTLNGTSESYIQLKVLNKRISSAGDSIIYLIEDSTFYVSNGISGPSSGYWTGFDSIVVKEHSFRDPWNSSFLYAPDSIAYHLTDPQLGYVITGIQQKIADHNFRVRKEVYGFCFPSSGPASEVTLCGQVGSIHCSYQGNSYLEGVGLERYLFRSNNSWQGCFKYLNHYQKLNAVWGNPFRFGNIPVNTPELSNETTLIFPNPAQDNIRIKDLPKNWRSIHLTDCTGKIILDIPGTPENEIVIQLESVSSGMYILTLQTDKRNYHHRLIRQ